MIVPIIDGADTQSVDFSQRFGGALEGTGFAIIKNHGISAELLRSAAITMGYVFGYPDSFLQKYRFPGGGGLYGFTPFQVEHAKDYPLPDLKRFWHVHRPPTAPNIWPAEVPAFQSVMSELFERLDELSFRLLDSLDTYLNYPAGTLRGMAVGGDSLLRLLHYPPVEGAPGGAVRSAPHEDINLLTLLVAATTSGLEVQARDYAWHAVNEEPGSIVVNAADMLQMLTKGRLRSTTHRVVNPPQHANKDRYSAPFFVHPRPEVVLDPATGFTAGEYLTQRLHEIGLYGGDTNKE